MQDLPLSTGGNDFVGCCVDTAFDLSDLNRDFMACNLTDKSSLKHIEYIERNRQMMY